MTTLRLGVFAIGRKGEKARERQDKLRLGGLARGREGEWVQGTRGYFSELSGLEDY